MADVSVNKILFRGRFRGPGFETPAQEEIVQSDKEFEISLQKFTMFV